MERVQPAWYQRTVYHIIILMNVCRSNQVNQVMSKLYAGDGRRASGNSGRSFWTSICFPSMFSFDGWDKGLHQQGVMVKQLTCFRWVDDAVHFLHMYVNAFFFIYLDFIDAAACRNSMCLSGFQITCVFVNMSPIRVSGSDVLCKMITSLQPNMQWYARVCKAYFWWLAMFFPVVFLQDLLSKMPKGGTLINTARVEVVHEADMLDVLKTRTDFLLPLRRCTQRHRAFQG